ncbi:uncharacterized protein EDB91DRAFT_1253712 [Suillus paluster]|uniref:uncharacterized protein n=1 Tax=Suillus paluster TaxID=48578 RepID=UPI001B86D1B4|nr:uncharacterized protein EDB91DRAFT_1253712 [Suillus paluster]KAG1727966.1 hypothetical protein EDB91DRAFT_1253712 [Suillus paluster]
MSSAQDANNALDLVSDKIAQLITWSEKLKQGDAAAKSLAHEIAITLVGAFAQYGNAVTSFAPRLLSCAAEICDKSSPNGKLRGLPDWMQISDNDPHIQVHPLFHKTIGYTCPAGPSTQEARLASPVSVTLSPIPSPTPLPSPPPAPAPSRAPKHNLFVPGTKCKASTPNAEPSAPEGDVIVVVRTPLPKKLKMELAVRKTATPPPSVSDEDSAEDTHPMRLFLTQCEQCIKDDVPCTMMLGKKNGEVRKCCRNCDGKKTKCVRLSTDQQRLLQAAVALKGVKAAAAAEKKARNGTPKNNAPPTQVKYRTRSRAPVSTRATSRICQALTAEDDVDAEVPAVVLPAQPDPVPTPTVDNDINIDFSPPNNPPTHPNVPKAQQDVGPNPSVAQPMALDIFKSVEALSWKFDALLKTLDDRAEAFNQQMDSWVTALDQDWGSRFALMENRLWEVEIKTANNTMSIRHVANSVRGLRAGQPLNAPPEGHPFGPIPPAWLALPPGTHEAIQSVDQGISVVGKEWTTVWDPSKASGAHGPGTTSASAVFPAGSPTLPSGSHLSSIPSTPNKSEK